MKKVYKKPMFLVENFLLSDYVAACTYDINFSSTDCNNVYDSEGNVFFWLTNGIFADGCGIHYSETDISEEICYHTPTSGKISVFNS